MNNLTLIIYLADLFPGLIILFRILGSMIFAITLLWVRVLVAHNSEHPRTPWPFPKAMIITLSATVVFLFTLSVFIPGKQTILLMAGSEVGETIVKTPEAQELLGDIRQVIHDQLQSLKKGDIK